MKNEVKKIGIPDVLKAYWRGIRSQKAVMFFTIFAFTIGNVLFVIIPLFYKRFFDLLTTNEINNATAVSLVHCSYYLRSTGTKYRNHDNHEIGLYCTK